jgi:DNA-binding NtrC family response regulator
MEKILVVDDDTEQCDVLKEFLTLKGYEVYTATNGPAAIDEVKRVRPHVVLLDIRMPEVGGIEVLKEVKEIDPTVGVIMITGVADEEEAMKTFELGAYDYITKPIDFNYLETALRMKIVDLLG